MAQIGCFVPANRTHVVVFLHKIVEGSASRSYGIIHVAKIAGAPDELLRSAQDHLEHLNSSGTDILPVAVGPQEVQLSLFDTPSNQLITRLRNIDLMNTTPSKALMLLEEIQELV